MGRTEKSLTSGNPNFLRLGCSLFSESALTGMFEAIVTVMPGAAGGAEMGGSEKTIFFEMRLTDGSTGFACGLNMLLVCVLNPRLNPEEFDST